LGFPEKLCGNRGLKPVYLTEKDKKKPPDFGGF